MEIVASLGDEGGNVASLEKVLQVRPEFSLQFTCVDCEQYEQRYESEPKLIRLRHYKKRRFAVLELKFRLFYHKTCFWFENLP